MVSLPRELNGKQSAEQLLQGPIESKGLFLRRVPVQLRATERVRVVRQLATPRLRPTSADRTAPQPSTHASVRSTNGLCIIRQQQLASEPELRASAQQTQQNAQRRHAASYIRTSAAKL